MKKLRWILVAAALVGCGDDDGMTTADGPRFDAPPQTDGRTDALPPTSCSNPATLADPAEVTGDNTGGTSAIDGECSIEVGGGGAPEVVYQLTPAVTGELQVRVSGLPDLAVYARTTCADPGTELACADFLAFDQTGAMAVDEGFGMAATAGTPIFIVVDGFDADTGVGAYTLRAATADNTPACTGAGVTAATLGDNAGTTMGGSNLLGGSCSGAFTPEKVFTFTVPGTSVNDGTLTLTLSSVTDQGLHVRGTCADPGSELACRDLELGDNDEIVTIPVRGGDVPFVIVEPFTEADLGPFSLNVAYQQATCGDSMLHGFEECDPPNAVTCGADCRYIPEGTVNATAQCTNWVDDDGDELGDCGDDGCQAIAECVEGAGAAGSGCDAATDCAATADDPACISEARFGWGGGYCTEHCADGDDCPAGSRCLTFQGQAVCIKTCATVADCAAGQSCEDPGDGTLICVASCSDNAHCPLSNACDTATGVCGNPEAGFCADGLSNDADRQPDCIDADCAGDTVNCPKTEVESNDAFGTANAYVAGTNFRGYIQTVGDQDWVAVTLATGQTMVAATNDFGTGGCANLLIDTQLTVYQPDGTTVVPAGDFTDDTDADWCSQATIGPVATGGVYYVQVTASSVALMSVRTFGYGMTITVTGP